MLWRGIEIEPQWVALALLVIAVALGRGRQFVFDFFPFLLLFFAYEVMRGFASKTGFAPHDLSVLERPLFGGNVPTLLLQRALYHPGVVGWLDLAGMFFYFMHFVLPVAMGFVFWLSSRDLYWRFAAALLILSFLAFVTYLFFPSTPPWLQFPHLVHKVSDETVTKLGLGYFVSPLYRHLNPNLYAAFPSLHAAYPVLAAVYAWTTRRRVSLALFAWAACVWFSVVYLGEHYVVDALDGLLYVAAAVLVVELVGRRLVSGGRGVSQTEAVTARGAEEPNGRHGERRVAERDQAEQEQREAGRRP
jgi:hypothetical protein